MLGKLKNNITRRNHDELLKKYKYKIIVFAIIVAFIVLLIPFGSLFNKLMKLYPDVKNISSTDMQIHVVDVGEALCTMIKFPTGKTLVFDAGTSNSWKDVDRYLEKMLLDDDCLDYLIISHIDSDHSGNANNIYKKYNPKYIFVPNMTESINNGTFNYNSDYGKFYTNMLNDDIQFNYNYAGRFLKIGDVVCTWLAPNREYYTNSNDYSAVVLVKYNNFEILLTGDSGFNAGVDNGVNTEAEFIGYASLNNINLDVDVLIAGHHGSKYSTGTDLLESTTPKTIIISVGDNSYGHPAEELYERILEYDKVNKTNLYKNILTTDGSGSIVVSANAEGNYLISEIGYIGSYLFISFIIIDLVLFVPSLYCLLDSIMIYKKILNAFKKQNNEEQK